MTMRYATRGRSLILSVSIAASLLWLLASTHYAEVPVQTTQAAADAGKAFEDQHNWKEAVRHYKDSLKQWPEDQLLSRGLRRSQFQYSIDRRYADNTFLQQLKPLSKQAGLELYGDVLKNVREHFVDSINTTSIVAHGTESLWLALGNERFVNQNLFGASEEKLVELRRALYERYWNKPVYGPSGATQLVDEVISLSNQIVGLESGPVVMEYVFGACNCLDDYSNVLTPGKRSELFGNINGEFVGIGIVMEGDLGKGMKLLQVLPQSPAAEQGLQSGDIIVSVDGTDCRYLATEEAAGLLAGQSGSTVKLEVSRNTDSRLTVNCQRREVQVKSIPLATMIDTANGIGYIQMTGFQYGTLSELDDAIAKLSRQGMRSLVWDLRGNPGGLLDVAAEVLDRFIEDGILVSTKGRSSDSNSVFRAQGPGTWNIPIALLVDGNSASASEIVAGAIRDHKRGVIVGRTTFGKWSVQTLYDGRFGTGIRLTTAKFYSPNGSTWSKIGLSPDVEVKNGPEKILLGEVNVEQDPDVREAIQQLKTPTYTQR